MPQRSTGSSTKAVSIAFGVHLTLSAPPQNCPGLIQAGTSLRGVDLAAKYADAVFAIHPVAKGAAGYYAQVKSRVSELGRNPDHCAILF